MYQCFIHLVPTMALSLSLMLILFLIRSAHGDCPLQINPQIVVVSYGSSVSVNCTTSVQHDGMGWESTVGAGLTSKDNLITWRVSSLTDWNIEPPLCLINPVIGDQCESALTVTVYKAPDSVSISTVTPPGPMKEGNQYELQCDVLNVAPVQNLTVRWYKGQTLVNQTSFIDTIRTPVSKTIKLLINPEGADDGVQYRCEAELDLGEEGPRPPPTVTSEPLNITVYSGCPLQISLQKAVVSYGSSVSVNCTTSVQHDGMGWKSTVGAGLTSKDNLITWRVSSLTDWKMEPPFCYINFTNGDQCESYLPVTVYKTPDSVSISTVTPPGPVIEGNQYELQCDVLNVAPVQNLTVRWYKGQNLVNQTSFTDTIRTPVSKTIKLLINPEGADDGVQYRCEAELDLGEEGPRPPPTVTSEPLNITVYSGCPLQISLQKAVVSYGSSVSVNCTTSVQHDGMGWKSTVGAGLTSKDNLITWRVSSLTDWKMEPPFCYINFTNGDQCELELPVTVYKTPDSVSISTGTHTGPMLERNQYELQCDVLNVAPVQNLTVRWYKGQNLVNQTSFTDTIRTLVSKTIKLLINPEGADDGVQYRCEAELDLGEEGPRPPPIVTSEPLNITVYSGCPLQINPQKTIVSYGSSVSVNCTTSVQHDGMGWESTVGAGLTSKDNLITWRVSSLTDWNMEPPFCYINRVIGGQCESYLLVTVYKTPDSVSISTGTHTGPVIEGNQYELQCDVLNVAPVQNLTVRWYKGQTLVDQTSFTDTIRTPVNESVKLLINPNRADEGVQYRCEAELDLGEDGPRPPPTVTSEPLSITVHYAPVIHATKETFDVVEEHDITLECNSSGNPEPDVWWSFKNKNISTGRRYILFNITKATSNSAGVYTCHCTNEIGRDDKNFTVKMRKEKKEKPYDYIPVVATVLTVLVFLFILVVIIILLKLKKSRGYYEVQSMNIEMTSLSNGGQSGQS